MLCPHTGHGRKLSRLGGLLTVRDVLSAADPDGRRRDGLSYAQAMDGPFDGPAALRHLQAATRIGILSVEEVAFRFETILGKCHFGDGGEVGDMPAVMRDLVNRMVLIRFTVDKMNQPRRIAELLDDAVAVLRSA